VTINAIGHFGICVTDLEGSLDFYENGLGFHTVREWDFKGKSWGRIMEVDGLLLHSKILRRDHVLIELMHFESPAPSGSTQRRPWNQIGFTHLAVWVDDIDAEAQHLERHGGRIVESTRTVFDLPSFQGRWLVCTDPDGNRIELVEYPEGESILET
jgi:catechol 2,3-dioxygenase-like lactoylglutathione lyase family enzyme